MKTDLELLTLAAKAIGLVGDAQDNFYLHLGDKGPVCAFVSDDEEIWCPLHDDGDAFRLKVKLRLDIHFEMSGIGMDSPIVEVIDMSEYEENEGVFCSMEDCTADPYAATRRAIVRAAAHIGEAMSNQLRTVAIDQSDAIEQYMGFPDERLWDQK